MALFRIHRIKPVPGQAFRWAPHTGGLAIVKERDYERGDDVESPSIYAAWKSLAAGASPLTAGDMIEDETGKLHILKYIGFEPAQWFVPESKAVPEIPAPSLEAASGVGQLQL